MREPLRSRLYILLGVLLSLMMWTGLVAQVETDERWPPVLLLTTIVTAGMIIIGGAIRGYLPSQRRRKRFTVARGAFLSLPVHSPGVNTVLSLISVAVFVALAVDGSQRGGEGVGLLTAATVAMAVIALAHTLLAWSPFYVALTPQGVAWRSALYRRLVPWEALAPGGPATLGRFDRRLTLAVARPEAVTSKGFTRWNGPAEGSVISGQFDVDPRLMAAAIRWYVEHPEDRPAIGTQAEHDRLLASVAVP